MRRGLGCFNDYRFPAVLLYIYKSRGGVLVNRYIDINLCL